MQHITDFPLVVMATTASSREPQLNGMDNTRTGPKVNSLRKLFTHNKLMHTQLTLTVATVNTT